MFRRPPRLTLGVPLVAYATLYRSPALRLARAAAEAGGTMPAVLNAANEIAVAAFLDGRLAFAGLPGLIERVLDRHSVRAASDLDTVLEVDRWARATAQAELAGMMESSRAKA
jgi:1-deoxy-D-xylulose-5-phosphate reductoisomerase